MNNRMLLRIAMAMCSVNVLFALLSMWSVSSARARLNEGLQQAERSIAEVSASAATEIAARKDAVAAAEVRLQAAEKEISALRARVFTSAPQPRRVAVPTGKSDAASDEPVTQPVNPAP
jgi:hypothetical protein